MGWVPGREVQLNKKKLFSAELMMQKTWPLCTSAESNLRDRVLSEVEKNSFIALPGKGDSNALHALKNCVSQHWKIFIVRSFIVMVQGWGYW